MPETPETDELVRCAYGALCPPFPMSEMSDRYIVPVCPRCVRNMSDWGTN